MEQMYPRQMPVVKQKYSTDVAPALEDIINKVNALVQEINSLTARVKALEG